MLFIRQRQMVSFLKPVLQALFWLLRCLPSCSAVTTFWCLCSVSGCLCSDRWTSWDTRRLGLRKYSSIDFNGIETSSEKCELGRFVLGEQDGKCVFFRAGPACCSDPLAGTAQLQRKVPLLRWPQACYVSKLPLWPVLSAAPRELSRHFVVSWITF